MLKQLLRTRGDILNITGRQRQCSIFAALQWNKCADLLGHFNSMGFAHQLHVHMLNYHFANHKATR